MNGGSISQGLLLLSSYSLGLAIPFLLAALGIGWVSTLLKKFSRIMRITEVVMGSLMVVVGLLLMTGAFNMIAIMFPGWSFGL
jgi:cytochrome c-type biogenesis protein